MIRKLFYQLLFDQVTIILPPLIYILLDFVSYQMYRNSEFGLEKISILQGFLIIPE